MKKTILVIAIMINSMVNAQSGYEKGMTKAFELWRNNKTVEATQLFERISKVEKNNWLPSYYVATLETIGCFGLKDETKLIAKLTKAQKYLDEAKAVSKNNPEIIIAQALLNTAYIAFDGQKYGMKLSGTNYALYAKALQLAPNNPRVILGKAEWDMGGAKFFGKSIKPFCNDVKRALELFKTFTPAGKFYPTTGKQRAEEILKECNAKE